jgi:hypothetical protein
MIAQKPLNSPKPVKPISIERIIHWLHKPSILFLGKKWVKTDFFLYACWTIVIAMLFGTLVYTGLVWPMRTVRHGLIVASLLAFLLTVALGWYLGWNSLRKHVVVIVSSGTIALMLSYVLAWVLYNPHNWSSSESAAAGVAVLILPTTLVIALSLALGVGIGRLTNKPDR